MGRDLGWLRLAGGSGLLVGLGVGWFAWRKRAVDREERDQASRKTPRRAGGGGLLVIQEFIEPRTVHVQQAQEEWAFESEQTGPGDGQPTGSMIGDALLSSLCRAPIDIDEVRGQLGAADRAGLDWRRLYQETAELVRTTHPQLAPSLPPPERVAPRISDDQD